MKFDRQHGVVYPDLHQLYAIRPVSEPAGVCFETINAFFPVSGPPARKAMTPGMGLSGGWS